ncbi:hypothetical protein ACN47E_008957 [Coniothyrium glycines]
MESSDTTSIPVIDLSKTKNPALRTELLVELRRAVTSVGFLYISNHGVPQIVIESLIESLPQLFGLSTKEKEQIALHKSPHFLGYSAAGAETTAGKADNREQFEFATELTDDWTEDKPIAERLRGPNQWPEAFPALRPILQKYMSELTSLSENFLKLVAEALQLPELAFLPFLGDQHRLKLVRYPASTAGEEQGVGPHKDSSGWWTFLLQASPAHVKGLQVLNKLGEWIDVPNLPGTFVVNVGQGFEVVTNGVCKATTHRVLSSVHERFSVPFFQGMRRSLTKKEAVGELQEHFKQDRFGQSDESKEGRCIDSAFLRGHYDTWGESQLRTKIRSHQNVGRIFYADVIEEYINDG